MPNPDVVVVNFNFATGRLGAIKTMIEAVQEADIVLGIEAREMDTSTHILEDLIYTEIQERWSVVHYNDNPGQRGNFFAMNEDFGELISWRLVDGLDVPGMHERYFLVVKARIKGIGVVTFIVFHMPPKRYWRHWPKMMRMLIRIIRDHKGPIVLASDWNKLLRAVRVALRKIRRKKDFNFDHIIGIVTLGGVKLKEKRARKIGRSDHKSVVGTLVRRQKRARKK